MALFTAAYFGRKSPVTPTLALITGMSERASEHAVCHYAMSYCRMSNGWYLSNVKLHIDLTLQHERAVPLLVCTDSVHQTTSLTPTQSSTVCTQSSLQRKRGRSWFRLIFGVVADARICSFKMTNTPIEIKGSVPACCYKKQRKTRSQTSHSADDRSR